MIGIILAGHGSFPQGIYESVKLIVGEVENLRVVSFTNDTKKLQTDLEQAIREVDKGNGVVCLTDLAGGTPFNISSRIAMTRNNVHVIGGINLPLLLSGLFQRDMSLEKYIENMLIEGRTNIKQFTLDEKRREQETEGI